MYPKVDTDSNNQPTNKQTQNPTEHLLPTEALWTDSPGPTRTAAAATAPTLSEDGVRATPTNTPTATTTPSSTAAEPAAAAAAASVDSTSPVVALPADPDSVTTRAGEEATFTGE